jgi:hypothetical protein
MKTIVFTGALTTITPLSFVTPNAEMIDKGIPRLPRLSKRLYITASSIRSAVRHAATDLLIEMQGTKPPLEDYFLLANGGIRDDGKKGDDATQSGETPNTREGDAKKESDGDDYGLILRNRFVREKNPAVVLFGSYAHGVPGALYCDHAIAGEDVDPVVVRHVRANDFMRDPELADRLDPGAIDAFIARQAKTRERSNLTQRIKDLKKAIVNASAEDKQALSEQIKKIEAQKADGGGISLALPNLGYEAIPQGAVLEHSFVLERVSDLEIALFLQALDRFALTPYLGGKRNHGLGRVSGRWTVRGREDGERALKDLGSVQFKGDFDGLQATDDIARFLDANILREKIGAMDLRESSLAALR